MKHFTCWCFHYYCRSLSKLRTVFSVPWTSVSDGNGDASCAENLWYKVFSFFLISLSFRPLVTHFKYRNLKEGGTKWPSPAKTEVIRNFAVKFTVSQFCGQITSSLYTNLIGWIQYLNQEARYINSELGCELYAFENMFAHPQ